jgi:hypothetical protein
MQTMPYPAKKTDKLVAEVLERLSLGETLKSIARDLQFSTVAWNQWVRSDEALTHAHAEAREAGADAVADDVLEIVDTPPERFEGKIDNGSISWARNRADFRLKLLGFWQPTKYGVKTPDNKNKSEEEDKIDEIDLMLRVTERLLSSKRDAE